MVLASTTSTFLNVAAISFAIFDFDLFLIADTSFFPYYTLLIILSSHFTPDDTFWCFLAIFVHIFFFIFAYTDNIGNFLRKVNLLHRFIGYTLFHFSVTTDIIIKDGDYTAVFGGFQWDMIKKLSVVV